MSEQKASEELKIASIPEILPVLPLAGAFVFPKMLFRWKFPAIPRSA